jgi:hypothetical protein
LKAQTSIIHFKKEEVVVTYIENGEKNKRKLRERILTQGAMQTQTLTRRGCTAAQGPPYVCLGYFFLSFFSILIYLYNSDEEEERKKKRSPSC